MTLTLPLLVFYLKCINDKHFKEGFNALFILIMTVIEKTLKQIKKLQRLNKQAFINIIESSIRDNENELLKRQLEQLDKGENKDGSIIGTYSSTTEMIAAQSNPIKPKRAGTPYNLQWSGDLFRKTILIVDKTSDNVKTRITSTSSNLEELKATISRSGKVSPNSLFGFNKESKLETSQIIGKDIKSKTKKYVQL